MSIMEMNLPVADSVAEGDKVRIVTSGGISKQIDASAIGGGGSDGIFKVTIIDDGNGNYTSDKSVSEISEAILGGKVLVFYNSYDGEAYQLPYYQYLADGNDDFYVYTQNHTLGDSLVLNFDVYDIHENKTVDLTSYSFYVQLSQ